MKRQIKWTLGLVVLIAALIGYGCDSVTEPTIDEVDGDQIIAGQIIDGSYIVVMKPDETVSPG